MDPMRFLTTTDPFEAAAMIAVANKWFEEEPLSRNDMVVRQARAVWGKDPDGDG